MTHRHSCIKCQAPYSDEDEDAYLCDSCVIKKNAIASELDAKHRARSSHVVKTDLQSYDEAPKVHGFMQVRL
jgi:uncharacterized Zn ribbon protein